MSPFLKRRPAPRSSTTEEARRAVAEYLALSRSSLRVSDPTWFWIAESAAWDRLCAAVGIRPAAAVSPPVADAPPAPVGGRAPT